MTIHKRNSILKRMLSIKEITYNEYKDMLDISVVLGDSEYPDSINWDEMHENANLSFSEIEQTLIYMKELDVLTILDFENDEIM